MASLMGAWFGKHSSFSSAADIFLSTLVGVMAIFDLLKMASCLISVAFRFLSGLVSVLVTEFSGGMAFITGIGGLLVVNGMFGSLG